MATSKIFLPQSIFDFIESDEFKLSLYRTSKGKEPTKDWAVDRMYNSLKFPLYHYISYILYISKKRKYEYTHISSLTLKSLFGNKYQAVRDIILDYFDGHVFKSKDQVESYCADPKIGFCKKYMFNPSLSLRMEKKVEISIPRLERKRIMKILHQTKNPKIIEAVEERTKKIEAKESASEELKSKVEYYRDDENNDVLKSKKTDSRYYGLNVATNSQEKQQLLAPNDDGEMEDMIEVDYSSFHPRILSKLVYHLQENVSKDLLSEQQNWKSINQEYGDIYTYIASKMYNREPIEITKEKRKICKNTFLKILNTNYGSTGTVEDDFEWKVVELLHEELPLYTEVLLKIDSIEDIHRLLPKWKYEKFKDDSSLTYRVLSTIEYNIMINVLEKVMERWEDIGFLWLHDGVYVPQSHADEVREIMEQEFENYTV